MSGFLSAYSNTRKIPVGDPDRGYWIELREHISQGDKEHAERALAQTKMVGGELTVDMDTVRFRQRMFLASVVSWNLDDENGQVWPVNEQSIRNLPGDVFDGVWKIIDEMNKPAPVDEKRRFPDSGDDSH